MTRPNEKPPLWATDDVYASGDDVGNTNKIAPLTGEKTEGYHRNNRPPAEKFNWNLNRIGQWIDYLSDVAILNWHSQASVDIIDAAFNNDYFRLDSTNEIFYAPLIGYWVVLGGDTAGKFWAGNESLWAPVPTGEAIKFAFGCETADGRVLLFNGDFNGIGVSPTYRRSAINNLGGAYTGTVLPGTVTLQSYAGDVILSPTGRIIVVGCLDLNQVAWTSDDNGATWATRTIGAMVSGSHPMNRVMIGTDDRIIAHGLGNAAQGGDRFYYSDDDGVTWTARTGLSFHSVVDTCYVAGIEKWIFATDDDLHIATDPVTGPFTTVASPNGDITCVRGFGSAIVIGTSLSATDHRLGGSWDGGLTFREIRRSVNQVSGFLGLEVSASGQFGVTQEGGPQVSLKLAGHP